MSGSFLSVYTVHPHTRGDHYPYRSTTQRETGSPPHAWGSLLIPADKACYYWFTPTRVGITQSASSKASTASVHPHTRGDHGDNLLQGFLSGGSPPHAWGSHSPRVRYGSRNRFTPTRVGITYVIGMKTLALPVHPHTRGDHTELAAYYLNMYTDLRPRVSLVFA